MSIFIKIRKSYRNVVAVADSSLIGKKFEEGKRQLDVRESFYKGEEYSNPEEAIKVLQLQLAEDATFNIAGKDSVRLAIQAGIIMKESTAYVKNIPFALRLL